MGAIHQLYATHCTYGSSAIERRTTGESRDRVLGYSARASSFSPSDLRRHFRTIERFLYYYLPKETPPDKKQTLTPQAAPHRFFFCPSLSGLQTLGYISYRQTDCAGRVGSYFAHLLASVQDKNEPPWDVLECLQLWNSPGWVIEDRDSFSHDLPSLGKPSDLRGGTLPAVDERVLWSFLNTAPGGSFHCPGPLLLPKRWTMMSVADRRRYFRLALMGYLEISSKERESLLLLIEPAVAVLFFYGIARLLPAGLRAQLSFSTFETNADRLITSLAALTFDDEVAGGDVPADRYKRGFVLNTWQDRASDLQDPNAKYADFVLGSLMGVPDSAAAALAHAIDQKLARFQQADAAKASDLEEFVKAHDIAEAILKLKPNVAHEAWKKSPAQTAYVRKAVRQKLSGPADPAYLASVLNSPQYLQLMLETALQGDDDDNCTASLKYLVERVQPLDALESLLGDGGGARRYKLHALLHYVKEKRRLPGQCRWLWAEKRSVGRGPQKPQLLLELLQSPAIDAQLVRDSLNDVPDEGLPLLFRGLLKASLDQSERTDLLMRISGRPGFDVITLVNDIKSELASYGALLGSILCGPLKAALDRVHEQPGRFGETTSALDAGKSLVDPSAASRARAWLDLKGTFDKYQKDMAAQQTSLKPVSGRKIWAFTEEVCKCLDRCFPIAQFEVFRKDKFRDLGAFIRQVAAANQVGQLVPEKFDEYLIAYFRTDLHAMKRISNRGSLAWAQDHPLHTAGIAVAAIVLLMAGWIVVRNMESGGTGETPVAQAPPETVEPQPKPADSPKPPAASNPPGTPNENPSKEPAKVDAAPPPPQQETPVAPAAKVGDDTAEQKPEAGNKTGSDTSDQGVAPKGPGQEPGAEPEKVNPEQATPGAEPPKPMPETAPQAPAEADQPAPESESVGKVLVAEKPLKDAFERLGQTEIFQNLGSGDCMIRLHGAELAQNVRLSVDANPGGIMAQAQNDFGEFVGLDAKFEKGNLKVAARFKTRNKSLTYPLATFGVKDDGTGTLYCDAADTDLQQDGFTPRTRFQKDALRYCVVEVRPKTKQPPQLVALIKPQIAPFPLSESGSIQIQYASQNQLRIPTNCDLKLGMGKVIRGTLELSFGEMWLKDAPSDKWVVRGLAEEIGIEGDVNIEVKTVQGNATLILRAPEPKVDRGLLEEKKKKLAPLSERKKKIEKLVLAIKNGRRLEDVLKSAGILADELKPADKGPGLPPRPAPAPLPISRNKQGEAIPQYEARDAENQRRLEIYQRGLQAYGTWIKDVLVPAGDKEVESLGQQIEAESPQPAEQADGNSQFQEWLKTGVQVHAYIYRLVPYDGPGEKRDIRVLVVEPGASVAQPDMKLGPNEQ